MIKNIQVSKILKITQSLQRGKYLNEIKKYPYCSLEKYKNFEMDKNLNMNFIFDKVIRNHTQFYLPFVHEQNKDNEKEFISLIEWLKEKNFDIEIVETFTKKCIKESFINCENSKKMQYIQDNKNYTFSFKCEECEKVLLKTVKITATENSIIEFDENN